MQIPAPAAARPGGGFSYKWVVAMVVIFGLFMTVLDGTIVNVAIPRLQNAFGANLNSVQWVLTGYTLAQGVATPLTAFLSDRIGTKRFYLLSLLGFTVGSLLCGFALNLPMLIFFRVLQGATGAFLSPLAITMLYHEFPRRERGTAMGVLGIPILLAPAFGPTLGGYIVTFANWPLIFFINVPIGIAGLIMGAIFLHEAPTLSGIKFDLPGFILSATGLATLLYGLSDASTDGWGSSTVLGFLAVGTILLIAFVILELRIARNGGQPLLDLRVFGIGTFTSSNIASILVIFALYGGLFLVPVYLQNIRGLSAYQSGLLLLPQAFASMLAIVVGGRLVDRLGVRAVVIPGLIILAISLFQFTNLNLTIPYTNFQLLLILRGLGIGLCLQPLTVSSLVDVKPKSLGQATAVNTTLRFVMSSLAVSTIATLVQSQTKVHYDHLAELVTPSSKLGQLIPLLQGAFMQHGASQAAAYTAALEEISGLLQRQGAVLAMQDAFWLTLVLAIAAIIASMFVGGRKKPEQIEEIPMTEAEKEEQQKALEEAAMAI
ncbi:MAG TPA: DHA2 family efflux MFS transporter permease subunit [Ktedonobacteraceae bacterium]|nr:DHA2 family efflux MFS transporter permease subunit [Ktedonobacteraceae bacterium]